MAKILTTGLLIFILNLIKKLSPYSKTSADLTKLKLVMWSLNGIKTLRLLSISFLGAGMILAFLVSGLILFHLTILFYAPWKVEVKTAITLIFGGLYILTAIGVFLYVYNEDTWIKMFHLDKMIQELSENPPTKEQPQNEPTSQTAAS